MSLRSLIPEGINVHDNQLLHNVALLKQCLVCAIALPKYQGVARGVSDDHVGAPNPMCGLMTKLFSWSTSMLFYTLDRSYGGSSLEGNRAEDRVLYWVSRVGVVC